MENIHTAFFHVSDAHDGIHIGPISIDQASLFMHYFCNFPDILLKKSEGIWVGDHDTGSLFIH